MKKIFLSIICAGFCAMSWGQSLQLLNINQDSRSMGMAGVGAALDASAFAAENNASSMAFSEKTMAVGATYGIWAPDALKSDIVGFGGYYRTGKLAVGLNAKYLSGEKYDIINSVAKVTGDFTPADFYVGVSGAYQVIPSVSVGLTAKFISSSIAPSVSGSAFAADISAMYKQGPLSAGVSVSNLGTQVTYDSESYDLPAIVKAGAAYKYKGLVASADVNYLLAGGLMAGLGLEYGYKDMAFVRAGYHYGDEENAIPSYASVGLGFKYAGAEFNAAYLLASDVVGNTMMFGIAYSF